MQIGINFADVFTCLGLYQAAPKENVIPGLEVLETIERKSTLPMTHSDASVLANAALHW